MNLNRRDLIAKCVALGTVSLAGRFSLAEATSAWDAADQKLSVTPPCELGPFYRKDAPSSADMRQPGERGLPLDVTGAVFNTRGEKLVGAKIEVWQADHDGLYDVDGDHLRATLLSDSKGEYGFHSVMPGHYPARVCQHVHYLVTAPGCRPLVTQLYFATDSAFDGDPDKNFTRDPLIWSRELVRPVQLKGDPQTIVANVKFELVLERL